MAVANSVSISYLLSENYLITAKKCKDFAGVLYNLKDNVPVVSQLLHLNSIPFAISSAITSDV